MGTVIRNIRNHNCNPSC